MCGKGERVVSVDRVHLINADTNLPMSTFAVQCLPFVHDDCIQVCYKMSIFIIMFTIKKCEWRETCDTHATTVSYINGIKNVDIDEGNEGVARTT
jgi:hypothetical protein